MELEAFGTMVYRPVVTKLLGRFGATPIAFNVTVELMGTGPPYTLLEVVGVEPSVV